MQCGFASFDKKVYFLLLFHFIYLFSFLTSCLKLTDEILLLNQQELTQERSNKYFVGLAETCVSSTIFWVILLKYFFTYSVRPTEQLFEIPCSNLC